MKKFTHIFLSRRMLVVLLLGFVSGLPLALTATTLQAWFTVANVNIMAIGVLTLVGQPYVYKFMWAPALDRYTLPILGRRRGWILSMQFCLAVALVWMAFMRPEVNPWGLAALALLVAVFSATQDIAIDAYRTDLLKTDERGLGSAMATAGYRVAMLVSGGLAMIVAARIGWRSMYLMMAGLMFCLMLVTWMAPPTEQKVVPPRTLARAVIAPFFEFITRRHAWVILAFIVLYKLSDAFALSLGTTFLIRGIGFSLMDVGAIYKFVGLIATLLGAFVGGFWMTRLSLFWALFYFGVVQGVSNLLFMALAMVGKSYSLMVTTIFLESFCGGLGTVAFIALLMSLCDSRFTATQFALFSAFSAVGRVFVGPFAALVEVHFGWVYFFMLSVVLMFPGLLLLVVLRNTIDEREAFHHSRRSGEVAEAT